MSQSGQDVQGWVESAPRSDWRERVVPVGLGVTRIGGRYRYIVTLRPELIGPQAAWLRAGVRYRLLCQGARHWARLRIENGGRHVMRGHGKTRRPCITLQDYDWLSAPGAGFHVLDHRVGDGWLEFDLPDELIAVEGVR